MLGPVTEGQRVRLEPPGSGHLANAPRWFADLAATRDILHRRACTPGSATRRALLRNGFRPCGLQRRHVLADGVSHDKACRTAGGWASS